MFTQIMCTFIFVLVILMIKGMYNSKSSPSGDGALLALAVVTVLGALIHVGHHAGASYNPAVTLGLTIFQTQTLENEDGYLSHYFYAYFAGPFIGGLLAGLFANWHTPVFGP